MKFRTYEESHTEWAIFFLKLVETILSFTCMMFHLEAVLYKEEPMPHNMLFCATFGGYFILGLSGILVPISGQRTPPGVDMVFGILAFLLLFTAASVAMYYVSVDEHFKEDTMTDEEEKEHPFFQHCRIHCIVSLITGTFYLMHAVISADRLNGIRKGLNEVEAEMVKKYTFPGPDDSPIVDIPPRTPISLYLFLMDLWLYIWSLNCMKRFSDYCICQFLQTSESENVKRRKHSSHHRKHNIDPHSKPRTPNTPGPSSLTPSDERDRDKVKPSKVKFKEVYHPPVDAQSSSIIITLQSLVNDSDEDIQDNRK